MLTTMHRRPMPGRARQAGVVLMMATPVFRVFIALLVFLKEKDYKYSLITLGVLLILILGSVFGIGEH